MGRDVQITYYMQCAVPRKDALALGKNCTRILDDIIQMVQPKVIFFADIPDLRQLSKGKYTIQWSNKWNAFWGHFPSVDAMAYMPDELGGDAQLAFKRAKLLLKMPPGGLPLPKFHHRMLREPKECIQALQTMRIDGGFVAADIETDGFSYINDDILAIGLAPNDEEVFTFTKEAIQHPEVQRELTWFFGRRDIEFAWQNGKFDCKFLRMDPLKYGIQKVKNCIIPTARCDFDTMLAFYLCDGRTGINSLKVWAELFFFAPDWEADIKHYLPNKNTPYSAIPEPILHRYLSYDVYYTRKGVPLFKQMMLEEKVYPAFTNVLMPAQAMFIDIESDGIPVDRAKLEEIKRSAEPKIKEAEDALLQEALKAGWSPERYVKETGAKEKPKAFNPNSHPQMAFVAYDLCKMPLFPTKEGKKKTCNKDAVDQYRTRHPFWNALGELKDLKDLFGIFVKGMLERLDDDDRVRPDFFLHGTRTGRLSCHDPNMQNIPRKSFVKELFVPTNDEWIICNGDYKTLEVVVAAILSGDKVMQAPFILGTDFHMETTKGVYGDILEMLEEAKVKKDVGFYDTFLHRSQMLEIRKYGLSFLYDEDEATGQMTPKEIDTIEFGKLNDVIIDYLRFLTKFITFGIMYGRGPYSLAEGELNCTVAEAQKYIDNFYAKYFRFYEWQKEQEAFALKHGYVTTPFSRKRRWPLITSENEFKVRNQADNTPIQSTASDICLLSAVQLHEWFKNHTKDRVLWLVHDSIVTTLKLGTAFESMQKKVEIATHPKFETEVPFVLELEIGPNYREVEGVHFDGGKWVPSKPEKASEWLLERLYRINRG
jgi:DNA polymerase I-like protein with 3'-5' exonuclease and polymerase domains